MWCIRASKNIMVQKSCGPFQHLKGSIFGTKELWSIQASKKALYLAVVYIPASKKALYLAVVYIPASKKHYTL